MRRFVSRSLVDTGQTPAGETSVILVLATTDAGLPDAARHLRDFGVTAIEVVAPAEARRLILASVPDDSEAARIVAQLRAEGRAAVCRPPGGAPLEAWTRHTAATTIGDRLTVCFAWSEHDRHDRPGLVELAGGGFGSGQHPATRLLLDTIERRIRGGERVLDVGCGSGVLGLSALRVGASNLVAVDTDGHAIEATRQNAELNGLSARVSADQVPLDEVGGVFDVVVANIGWGPLVALAPELSGHLAGGGWLGVSGFAPSHCGRIVAALRPLQVVENPTDGEWSALVLTA